MFGMCFPKTGQCCTARSNADIFSAKTGLARRFQAPSMSVMEVSFIQPGMAGAETTVQTEALQPVTESVETTQ